MSLYMLVTAAAANAAHKPQGPHAAQPPTTLLTITEVTVLRMGCLTDTETEQCIRARVPDVIVCEVYMNMKNAVEKPILLRAGRWSINPRSKGSFVFSFDGNIPFDHIMSYKHILLRPFQGASQLCPSLGWTHLLIHGVPFTDNDNTPFSPEALLKEVCTLPGLKRVHFAMAPCWLKPLECINPPTPPSHLPSQTQTAWSLTPSYNVEQHCLARKSQSNSGSTNHPWSSAHTAMC